MLILIVNFCWGNIKLMTRTVCAATSAWHLHAAAAAAALLLFVFFLFLFFLLFASFWLFLFLCLIMCGFCSCCYCCHCHCRCCCSWQCILTSRRTQIAKTAPWLAFSTLFHRRSVPPSFLLFPHPFCRICQRACVCVCELKVVSLWQARIDLPEKLLPLARARAPSFFFENHLHKIKSHRKINSQCVCVGRFIGKKS